MNIYTRQPQHMQIQFAQAAHQVASQAYEDYAHPRSPRKYTQPQLVACLLIMKGMQFSYRQMEEWLHFSDSVVATLRLKEIPTYSALAYASKRLLSAEKLDYLTQRFLAKTNHTHVPNFVTSAPIDQPMGGWS